MYLSFSMQILLCAVGNLLLVNHSITNSSFSQRMLHRVSCMQALTHSVPRAILAAILALLPLQRDHHLAGAPIVAVLVQVHACTQSMLQLSKCEQVL